MAEATGIGYARLMLRTESERRRQGTHERSRCIPETALDRYLEHVMPSSADGGAKREAGVPHREPSGRPLTHPRQSAGVTVRTGRGYGDHPPVLRVRVSKPPAREGRGGGPIQAESPASSQGWSTTRAGRHNPTSLIQRIVRPPSTGKTTPVMKLASCETR
jgi:hypothetical protein